VTIKRSHSVVVGDCKFNVSERIAQSNIPIESAERIYYIHE
jgi:hypothetical protein